MFDVLPTLIQLINDYGEQADRQRALRRMIIDECYVNLDLLAVLQTRCVEAEPAEHARLCAALQTASRQVLQVAKVDEQTLFEPGGRKHLFGLFTEPRERQLTDFRGWSAFELYHYVQNKIAVLQLLTAGDREVAGQLRLRLRIRNIRSALLALVQHLKRCWAPDD
jgi:hypothetical protein